MIGDRFYGQRVTKRRARREMRPSLALKTNPPVKRISLRSGLDPFEKEIRTLPGENARPRVESFWATRGAPKHLGAFSAATVQRKTVGENPKSGGCHLFEGAQIARDGERSGTALALEQRKLIWSAPLVAWLSSGQADLTQVALFDQRSQHSINRTLSEPGAARPAEQYDLLQGERAALLLEDRLNLFPLSCLPHGLHFL